MEKSWKEKLASLLISSRIGKSQAVLDQVSGVFTRTIHYIENLLYERPPKSLVLIRLALATNSDPNIWLEIVGMKCAKKQVEYQKNLFQMRMRTITMRFDLDDATSISEAKVIGAWLSLAQESRKKVLAMMQAYQS